MAGHRPRAGLALTAALVAAAAARAGHPQAAATPQQPTFPAEVELVTVDAAVTDRNGRADPGTERIRFHGAGGRPPAGDQQLRGDRGPGLAARAAATSPGSGRASRRTPGTRARTTGRTFVVVFDNRNLTLTDAHRAKGAIAQFLEKGAREGDRVMLVATEGDAWWSTRMEDGRPELVSLLKRLDGRLTPDLSPERITPWEAMRIHVYRDQEVAWRVLQRLERYNAVPADLTGRTQRQYVLDNPFLSQRASQVYLDSVNRNRATLELLRRLLVALDGSRGPQVGAARLGRLRLRHGARRVQARPGSRPALQRRHLLPRRARARGHAGGDDGAVRGGARGARPGDRRLRGRVLRRHHALGRAGLGGRSDPRRRERRLHDQEHQRPRRRHRPHRGRVGGLLPARLQAHEHAARRPLPQDRGQARARRGERARAQGLLRGARDRSPERGRERRTRASSAPSTRPTRAMPSRCA